MERIPWRSIVPQNLEKTLGSNVSGVYAWHYNLRFSKYDLSKFVEHVRSSEFQEEQTDNKRSYVENFLNDKLLSLFKYPDYRAKISGPLLPKYSGTLNHRIEITKSLVDRLIENPDSIKDISQALSNLSPEFSSPLYIGMASNIAKRLLQHKEMMVGMLGNDAYQGVPDITPEERNFAERINQRGFVHDNLFVCVETVSVDGMLHNSVENIMNRINYPVLGRN